ncbi:hypothetical protein EJB05_36366, partial [Eragrostis curvula]
MYNLCSGWFYSDILRIFLQRDPCSQRVEVDFNGWTTADQVNCNYSQVQLEGKRRPERKLQRGRWRLSHGVQEHMWQWQTSFQARDNGVRQQKNDIAIDVFVAVDQTHPQDNAIYRMLQLMYYGAEFGRCIPDHLDLGSELDVAVSS